MKRITLICMACLLLGSLFATDFVMKDGTTLIGTLYGKQDESFYIIDGDNQLHVVPIVFIYQVNDGFGDVLDIWAKRKDFMKDLPEDATEAPIVDRTSSPSPLLLTPPPSLPEPTYAETQLRSISSALWVMAGVQIAVIVGTAVFLISK